VGKTLKKTMRRIHKILKGFDHLAFFYKEEFRNIFSDAGVILIFIIAVFAYPLIYGIVYSGEVLKEVRIAVIDQSRTSESRKLVRMLDASEFIKITLEPNSLASGTHSFYRGDIHGLVLIPQDFAKKVLSGKQAHVMVYCDASYFLFYKQVFKGSSYAIGTYSAGVEVRKMEAQGIPPTEALKKRDPIPVITNALYNPAEGYASYVMLGVLILVLQQTLLIGIGMLGGTNRERKRFHFLIPVGQKRGGTIPIILGKSAVYLTIYMVNAIYVLGLVTKIFNFPNRGEFISVALFILPLLLSVIFLAMGLSSIYKNREHSMLVLVFTSIPFIFFSGISWPYESIPAWIKTIAQLVPSTPGIRGILKLDLMGASFSDVINDWLHLWLLTLVYFVFACFMLKQYIKRRIKEQAESIQHNENKTAE